jgi:hypothetical protein
MSLQCSLRGRTSPKRGLILFDPNKPCAAAIEPASERNNDGAAAREPARMIEENKMFDYSGSPAPPKTAATEPVFGGRENIDGNDHFSTNECLLETGNPSGTIESELITSKTKSRLRVSESALNNSVYITDRFNTIPDRVGPPGTEIAQEKVLATNSARNPLLRGPDSVATEPIINEVVEKLYIDHFYTSTDRVGPPGTEIEQEKVLATNSARDPLVRGTDLNQ